MKPNQEQKDLINAISKEISGWATTNDIDSPSHWNLIEEFCRTCDLSEHEEMMLNESLDNIMTIIKRTK